MRYLVVIFLLFSMPHQSIAQDLDALLDDMQDEQDLSQDVIATFKSTRIINGQSIEMLAAGDLEFRIAHRFGTLNTGAYDLWGLDLADNRLSLDYGITDWMMIGLGRSSFNNVVDGFAKFKIKRQQSDASSFIENFSINWYSNFMLNGRPRFDDPWNEALGDRFSFAHQLLIARKFNDRLSIQLSPTAIYQTFVDFAEDQNLRFALGSAARFKLTNRLAITAEHFWRIPHADSDIAPSFQNNNDTFSLGIDIETGGHVFQLHFTNSRSMVEQGFILENPNSWADGDIHFGFNITRNFTLKK